MLIKHETHEVVCSRTAHALKETASPHVGEGPEVYDMAYLWALGE